MITNKSTSDHTSDRMVWMMEKTKTLKARMKRKTWTGLEVLWPCSCYIMAASSPYGCHRIYIYTSTWTFQLLNTGTDLFPLPKWRQISTSLEETRLCDWRQPVVREQKPGAKVPWKDAFGSSKVPCSEMHFYHFFWQKNRRTSKSCKTPVVQQSRLVNQEGIFAGRGRKNEQSQM